MAIGAGLVRFQGKSGPPGNLYVGPLMTHTGHQRVAVRAVPCLSGNRTGPDFLQRSSSAHGRNG